MGGVSILTDNLALLPAQHSTGQGHLSVIPYAVLVNGKAVSEADSRSVVLPKTTEDKKQVRLIPPTVDELRAHFQTLANDHSAIIAILSSASFSKLYQLAENAITNSGVKIPIHLIDSKTTAAGLGFLASFAASLAAANMQPVEIERQVRSRIAGMYGILCTPGASYLYNNGLLDRAQASIVELSGLYPIFSIEDSSLIPLEKFKSARHAIAYFLEFLEEFDHVESISLMTGNVSIGHELKNFKDNMPPALSAVPFSRQLMNLSVTSLLGPSAIGLFVFE